MTVLTSDLFPVYEILTSDFTSDIQNLTSGLKKSLTVLLPVTKDSHENA